MTTITRRSFSALAGTGLASAFVRAAARQSTPAPDSTPFSITSDQPRLGVLGASRSEWEAAAGEGAPSGNLFVYTSPHDGSAPVTIGYTNDVVRFAEYDFSAAGDNGVARDVALETVSQALPANPQKGEQFFLPPGGEIQSGYVLQTFASQAITEDIAPVPAVFALLQVANTGINPDPSQYTHVVTVSMSLASSIDVEITPTGTPGGIGLERDAFIAAYGSPEEENYETEFFPGVIEQGMDLTTSYMPQAAVIQRIDGTAENADMKAITEVMALEVCGNSVPADTTYVDHCLLPATEAGPLMVRVIRLKSAEADATLGYDGSVLAMLFEQPDDPRPMVKRLFLGLNDSQFVDRQV